MCSSDLSPLRVVRAARGGGEVAPYFVEWVRQLLAARYGARASRQGLRVITSLDLEVQGAAERLMAAGCDEVGLADTTGYANPAQVKAWVRGVRGVVGEAALTGIHLHNTRGLGLANVLAALDAGLTTIDSSLGGLGGCPFAPGASGNIVTEDLVFMLDSMGLKTDRKSTRLNSSH